MILYGINDLKVGLKVVQNGDPFVIISNECVKPGKGQSFNRVRLKHLVSRKILEKTIKSGDYIQSACVIEMSLQYVYNDGDFWYFMSEKDFEQFSVSRKVIRDSYKWITDRLHYIITFWDGIPILVTPPNIIELKVIKTDAVMQHNSSNTLSSRMKLATMSTGVIVKVPLFINLGEYIRINTESGTYVSRAK